MEYPDYDYGAQQWDVDKVKLEFKTGEDILIFGVVEISGEET